MATSQLGLFAIVRQEAPDIAGPDTDSAVIVLIFAGVLFATFGSSMLACFTRREEVMKPLREKVGAVWLVALFYLIGSSLLQADLDDTVSGVLAGLISVQSLLGLTQAVLTLLRSKDAIGQLGRLWRKWDSKMMAWEAHRFARAATRIKTWRLATAFRTYRVRRAFWMGMDFAEAKRRFG